MGLLISPVIAGGGGGGASIGGSITGGTAGSVLFVATGPVIAEDNTNFFWDDTANTLKAGQKISFPTAGAAIVGANYEIGKDNTATAQLHFNVPTGAGMRWSINGTNAMVVDSSGKFGIGTTPDSTQILNVRNASSGWTLGLKSGVGAGVNSPMLDIVDSTGTEVILTPTSSAGGYIGIYQARSLSLGTNIQGRITIDGTGLQTHAASASSSGVPTMITVNPPNNTSITASTEMPLYKFSTSTQSWATGALTNQRFYQFLAPTVAFTAGSTLTNGATLYVDAAPIAGTNATLTNTYAVWVDAGAVRIDGRLNKGKGADVAAANDLTLGEDGNTFVITGNTQINAITVARWTAGSEINLIFTGTPTIKNNTAGGAGTAVLLLAGSADLVAANNTVLGLLYDGTQWQERHRKVA